MLADSSLSWTKDLLVPGFFTLLGAALGFGLGEYRDELKAKRAERSFLQAVEAELGALDEQLEATLVEVRDSARRFEGGGHPPQFAATIRNAVFTSQLGKLRSLDRPLLIEVIHFYSDLGTLAQIFESVNRLAWELSGLDPSSGIFTRGSPNWLPRCTRWNSR